MTRCWIYKRILAHRLPAYRRRGWRFVGLCRPHLGGWISAMVRKPA